MVTWELRALEGLPKIEDTQNVPDFDYAQFAERLVLGGVRISAADKVVPAWRRLWRPIVPLS
jgi:pyruvate dehydrogenase (quinone)